MEFEQTGRALAVDAVGGRVYLTPLAEHVVQTTALSFQIGGYTSSDY